MAKKDNYGPHKDEKWNRARGRRDGSAGKPSQSGSNRERNVGHKKSEEHSIKPKGNRG
jgi:hypothetical protein